MHSSSASAAPSSPNRSTYERRDVVGQYARSQELYPAEEDIFRRYPQFSGQVLDIAMGAGRTTRALLPACARYVGLDLSRTMIASARERFPDADLRVMDMRAVPDTFAAQRFDAILISYNSIDYIPWEDRRRLLAHLPDILVADGVLAFSTHDLQSASSQRRFHLREDLRNTLHTAFRPRSLAKFLLRAPPTVLKAWRNRLRNRSMEQNFGDYAYVNDDAEDYGLLTLYVSTLRQIDMLKAAGFRSVEILQPWLLGEPAYFNYFVCRR